MKAWDEMTAAELAEVAKNITKPLEDTAIYLIECLARRVAALEARTDKADEAS